MPDVSKPPTEWYYKRLQAVGRAQARYLLLLVSVSAYTVGLRLTQDDVVDVTFLGIPHVTKAAVEAIAAGVLGVLLLGLFGALQAARQASDELTARLHDDHVDAKWHQTDEHPNLTNFLEYATYVDGRSTSLTPLGVWFYALPVLAFVVWTVWLVWRGISSCASAPTWLLWVYRVDAVLVVAVLAGTLVFLRRRRELYRKAG